MSVTRSRRVVGNRRNAPVEGLERRTLLSTVVVNTALDTTHMPGSGTVSLRDAIAIANAATAAPTTITFDPTVFATAQTITMAGSTAFTLSNAMEATTIIGPAAGVTLDAGGSSTVLVVNTSATVSVSNVNFINGAGTQYQGGGIYNQQATLTLTDCTISNCTSDSDGGGLKNWGTTTLVDDTFSGNSALYGGGVFSGYASIYTITVTGCTFDNNSTTGEAQVFDSAGAGIYLDVGQGTLTNDTFTGNTGTDGTGVYVGQTDSASVIISDCTIDGNRGDNGLFNAGAASRCTVANTIVAGTTGRADAQGAFNSHGFNLIGVTGTSTGWTADDITGTRTDPVDPLLGPLANNTGPTETLLPGDGSPALESGSSTVVPIGVTTDQRGQPRAVDGVVDIGAVEVPKLIVVTAPASQTAVPLTATNVSLGSFTEAGTKGPYTVTVAWGDGTAATTVSADAGGTLAPVTHTFPAAGTDTVTVTVADETGLITGTNSFVVTVAQLPAIIVTPAAAQTALIATSTSIALGSFTQTSTTGPYTVTVNWGDNTAATTFTATGAETLPATAHAFATSGADVVTVTVANSGGTVTGTASFVVTVTTGATASAVTLASSTTTAVSGDGVTLTATVTPAAVTGVVTFESNGTVVGQVAVTNGVATLTTAALAVGSDSLTATYSGDHTYASSSSTAVPVTVLAPAAASTITLASSAATITTSDVVTLTATVTSSGAAVTLGVVTFYQGTTALGTANVSAAGLAVLTTTASLPVGTDVLTATYTGNLSFLTSTSDGLSITVDQTATATTLALSNPSKTAAQAITLTATIAPATVTATTLATLAPTGTVTFTSAGTAIGTAAVGANGVAVLTTAAAGLPLGVVQITATYDGDASFAASTSVERGVSVTAHALVPTIVSAVAPATAIGGAKVRGAVRVTLTNGLSDNQAGDEKGSYTVAVYASATTTFDPTDHVVASVLKSNTIRPGGSTAVDLPITTLPASLTDGMYHLLLVTTDARGNTEEVDTGRTVTVTAPVVSLTAAFATLSRNAAKAGAKVAITDAGNVDFATTLTATIGISTDALGQTLVATGSGAVRPVKVTYHPGRATKVKITGWQSLYAGLPIGSYYFTVTLTDNAGHTASAISGNAISKLTTA